MNFRRRSIFLLGLLLMGGIASAQVTIRGSVYGGGEGLDTIVRAGWVTGNTTVTMNGGTVERSIYGGGQFGSVGTYLEYDTIQVPDTNGVMVKVPVPKSNSRVAGTGLAKVVMKGGFLGGRGSLMPDADSDPNDDDRGWIFCGSRGEADSITYPMAIALGVVDSTYLFVGDTAVVTASVYGGCENGLVLGNTHVVIADSCQIGTGYKGLVGTTHTWDERYSKAKWEAAIAAVRAGDSATIASAAENFHECDHWPYGYNSHYDIYDIFYGEGSYNPGYSCDTMGSNGHSFFGNVFGGGSGFYPIAPGIWRRSAGQVNGNTLVEIQGGHILTSVYGGNEVTDVKGKSTVKMSGGTLGVPRTLENIAANPIPCYLFGGGMGDPRTAFNAWTNVGSTEIDITGGTIFGSVFGGGEEGHVLGNVSLTVRDSINGTETISPHIGTWGYSYVDGNVFGAGRGFSGTALTAGSVVGNTEVNIEGGTMLGSIYGGGRLASVGSYLVGTGNDNYGQLQEGDDHGFTTVNITGGTIGNTFEIEADSLGNYLGGNVFGGSMGRMTLLNGDPNPIWENLAKVKQTTVHINEATGKKIVIKGHVYGGGEIGRVEENTLVDIDKGTIGYEFTDGGVEHRLGGNVYGGGKGTPKAEKAGLVKGNAYVDMSNGNVHRSIYGGGEFASVGTFEYYVENPPADHFVGEPITCESGGLTSVIVSGGQVGLSHALMPTPGTAAVDDDFGYIFAGGRGTNDPVAYPKANILAVVDSTYLEISDSTYLKGLATDQTLINASIYGGCENGLVLRDTKVLITGGQIGNGYNKTAGTWDGVYEESKWTNVINAIKADNPDVGAITTLVNGFNECDSWNYGDGAGNYYIYDIFADSTGYESHGGAVTAYDGNSFFGNVFGGGSGYYPYRPGLWRRTAGRVYGNTNVEIVGGHILTSVYGGGEIADVMGTSSVKMTGGTVGVPQTEAEIAGHPLNSHVFGGGKGDSRGALFNGWTNVDSTNVCITGGVVFGSVFGGGEDGHVLRNTCVTIMDEGTSSPLVGTWGTTTYDGNVFGGGRGLSANAIAAGAVGGNTNLSMDGGRVLGSVFGGGRMASVGIQLEGSNVGKLKEDDGDGTYGYTFVNIEDGNIGSALETKTIEEHRTSGNVYGGSKGGLFKLDLTTMNPQWPTLGRVKQTEVNIGSSSTNLVIKGDVFGGGEIGTVRDSTQVVVSGGTLERDLFGGGYGSTSTVTVANCDSANMTPVMIAGRVYGRTDATVSGGLVKHNVYGGGEFAKVGMDVNQVTTIRQSTVSLNGGVVGSHVPSVLDPSQDTLFGGMVYGGGKGILADTTVAMVLGSTYIYDTVSNNSSPAHVLGDIHGAGELALVERHTYLTLGSLEVGTMGAAPATWVTKTLPNGGGTVNLYQNRALEGGRVFGGGRGIADEDYLTAALVMGNTNTEITGTAKINGSVYGGGDLANVGSATTLDELDNDKNTGSATVVISGGTIGPLNGSQSNGNVFGGGRGAEDMQNEIYYATVDSTHVVISGNASIAGSVFGGGANGRVLGNASTDIQGGTIGTTGLTEWDGNVYGGGRNLYAYANTTAAVFGNTDIQMSGGTIKANMYGGGRFGSVGMNYNTGQTSIETIQGADHGYVNINITGGTIGDQYVQYLGHYANGSEMPRTGYVFGGGRGIMEADKIDKLGNVKGTHVTVGGTAKVLSSVYGGGERGIVYDSTYVKMTGNAEVGVASEAMALHRGDVYGGGCGYDSIWNATENKYVFLHEAGSVKGNTRIEMDGSKVYGNIFGAGRLTDVLGHASVIISGGEVGWSRTDAQILEKPDFGYVYTAGRGEPQERFKEWTTVDSTYAEVSGGHIWSSLNGGGEEGHVNRNTHVVVKGGTIGTRGTTGNDGNVFGAGRGKHPIITGVASAAVSGNTQVDIQDGRIMGSVFGGGNRGSVGVCYTPITIDGQAYQIGDTIQGTDHGYTLVNVSGGQIGHEDTGGRTGGNVYGGSRGVVVDPAITTVYRDMANVKQTEVNIFEAGGKQTFIMGSVFGGGEDGHVFKDTYVNVSNGQIGGSAYASSPSLCSDRYHGNVYGGGRGLDTYKGTDNQQHFSTTAGVVYGNTNVMITGGRVTRNVYGGGNMSSVGIANEQPVNGVYKTGLAKVTITGGTVGVSPDLSNVNGMVFGSAHGKAGEAYKDLSMVKNTQVVITGNAQVKGSVFGSGEDGHTRKRTNVLVGDATVNGTSYTGNDLVIGTTGASGIDGNVYGGGRGLDTDESGNVSSTAGIVGISTTTLINNGTVLGSVFGGGNMASVGYELALDTIDGGNVIINEIPDDYGLATVTVTGNATIGSVTSELENGNVFGSGKGRMGTSYADLSYVHETEVLVNGNAQVYGSVFGGGEDGHVRDCNVKNNVHQGETGETTHVKDGNTHVTIDEYAVIGDESEQSSAMKGNVYGGGRGLDKDHDGNTSPTAGLVEANTKVDILKGTIWRSVFGGGNESVVKGQRVVNLVDGLVHADVHGGSNAILSNNALWAHGGLKTVNVRGGHVMGNVYGCSHSSNDGEVENTTANAEKWTSFVNISGGQIDEDVHGAGYAGLVNGSVCVNIGKEAILNAPNKSYNVNYNKPIGNWDQAGTVEPTASKLVIGGSVYGGSDYYGTSTQPDWTHNDITGYSLVYIDGTDYETESTSESATNYMNIAGGLYGSGTHSESGKLGRHILLREYGARGENSDHEMTSATRTLTTIQRAGNIIIDHANVNLSGDADITNEAPYNYGVMHVDDTLAVINASSIVLGSATQGGYAHMDSIYTVQSLNLASGTIYSHNLNELNKHSWYWVGIQDGSNDAKLYNITGTGSSASVIGALTYAQENVVIYNDTSKLWVRYHAKKPSDATSKQYYGELLGFFRMRGTNYNPNTDDETTSFAYARPKFKDDAQFSTENLADGGWLSYNTTFNYFTDEGYSFTNTQQYPYINVLDYTKDDREDYRVWVDPQRKNRWYVDGTRGWGRDNVTKLAGAGHFPDKPKRTLFGMNGTDGTGIVTETYGTSNANQNYSYKNDLIYVVGALTEFDNAILTDSLSSDNQHEYPLRLYRYPGGHEMSNGKYDNGGGTAPASDAFGVQGVSLAGPGANYGALLDVLANRSITLKGVVMDGLYDNPLPEADSTTHMILPANNTYGVTNLYNPAAVIEPLVITRSGSTLTLSDSTVLMRGYNGTNADVWYTNIDYTPYDGDGLVTAYHGGALFVDSLATVNVRDTVIITGNKQYLRIGDAAATTIESNVYLPTFASHVNITAALDDDVSNIGITSPKRNKETNYLYNTFSPVAVANDATNASNAYTNNNFKDDLGWFFVNNYTEANQRSTYYSASIPDYPGYIEEAQTTQIDPSKTLFFGWTWANVVRTAPDGFGYTTIDTPEDLVWLSNLVSNGTTISDVKQTDDIDLQQYVWVPAGTATKSFSESFDGQGHLIKNLSIDYIGTGDRRYERTLYGLFGNVNSGTIDRTFVVSGIIRPVGTATIGGLAGLLNTATLTNSEAALRIVCPDMTGVVLDGYRYAGGLVGEATVSTIHSSMAMPDMECTGKYDYVGGLVGGGSTTGAATEILNSFANAKFTLGDDLRGAGGLVGYLANMNVENCYIHLYDNGNLYDSGATTGKEFFQMAARGIASTIDYCYGYVEDESDYQIIPSSGITMTNSNWYNPVASSDTYGYMYSDNVVTTTGGKTSPLFQMLNDYVKTHSGQGLSSWTRPTLSEINGDLPVLLLGDDATNNHQGAFRSLATYDVANGGHALQYGGTVRDGEGKELSTMLGRAEDVFVYGDVIEDLASAALSAPKVAVYENAAIMKPGVLGSTTALSGAGAQVYVGITFDNTSRQAMDYLGNTLGRDWHMMSSPLKNAPLGMDYNGENTPGSTSYDPYTGAGGTLPIYSFTAATASDGYFPYTAPGYTNLQDSYTYPYDFYTWYEPDWQWINFKRNGPSHYHQDNYQNHAHIDYYYDNNTSNSAIKNYNESTFVQGKGYMMAIEDDTYMQSHGQLNDGTVSILVTNQANSEYTVIGGKGCNLIGNPYQAYLDFDRWNGTNHIDGYAVYDANLKNGEGEIVGGYRYYATTSTPNPDALASQYLHPHQGFFVKTNAANGGSETLQFKPTGDDGMIVSRSTATSEFRDDPVYYPLVNIFADDDEGRTDILVVEFNRPENGGGRKIKALRNGNHMIYSHFEDDDYATFFAEKGTKRVPVRFKTFEEDAFYTLRWKTYNGTFRSMYLVDNILGVRYDMLMSNSYRFESSKEDYLSRFYIEFDIDDTGIEEIEPNGDAPFAFFDGTQWVVNGQGFLQLFDVTGRVLHAEQVRGEQNRHDFHGLAKGVYLLRLTDHESSKVQKIILK